MRRRASRRRKKKIVWPYFLVLALAALIVAGAYFAPIPEFLKPAEASTEAETTESESESVTESEGPVASATDILNIEKLVSDYFNARMSNDVDTLNKLVQSDKKFTLAGLTDETQIISKYDRFLTYVIPTEDESAFAVYVTYDIYFKGIKTGAPSLNRFFVKKDTSGHYFIYDKEVSEALRKFILETDESDLVKGLKNEVEEDLEKACDKDPDLKELMSLISGK